MALMMPLFMTIHIWISRNHPRFARTMALYQFVHIIFIYLSMLSGEMARELLAEEFSASIAVHQERMELYFFFALFTLGGTLLGPRRLALYALLFASLVQLALCAWAAHAGAMIHHA
ncbi:MAG: hypothetical protein HS115_08085 [Spirochaetales bacterium]|nr:hypothetical protein [Spirochaetales bacterium]